MGTLDTQGMVTAFKVNRPLSNNEQQHRLSVGKPCSSNPHYELALIKFNSTYVECVDKWFSMRGFLAMGGGLFSVLFFIAATMSMFVLFSDRFWPAMIPL